MGHQRIHTEEQTYKWSNVIGSSPNVYTFGVMTEFMQDRNYTNILNMEVLLRNSMSSGFAQEFVLGRILTNILNIVKFLVNSHYRPHGQEYILEISLVLRD